MKIDDSIQCYCSDLQTANLQSVIYLVIHVITRHHAEWNMSSLSACHVLSLVKTVAKNGR